MFFNRVKVCDEMKKVRKYLRKNKIKYKDDSTFFDKEKKYWICDTVFQIENITFSVMNGFLTSGGYDDDEKDNEGLLQFSFSGSDKFPIGRLTGDTVISYLDYLLYDIPLKNDEFDFDIEDIDDIDDDFDGEYEYDDIDDDFESDDLDDEFEEDIL